VCGRGPSAPFIDTTNGHDRIRHRIDAFVTPPGIGDGPARGADCHARLLDDRAQRPEDPAMTDPTPRHPLDPVASNADDPTADRLAAYPEAGEVGSPQDPPATPSDGPVPPQPAGLDSAVIATGASGGGLAGPIATDAPGDGSGLPGPSGDDAVQRAPGAETGLGPAAHEGDAERMDR
jgi:hypothetical protein